MPRKRKPTWKNQQEAEAIGALAAKVVIFLIILAIGWALLDVLVDTALAVQFCLTAPEALR